MTKPTNDTTKQLHELLTDHEQDLTLQERLFLIAIQHKDVTSRQAKRVAEMHLKYNPVKTRVQRNTQSARRLRVDGEVT